MLVASRRSRRSWVINKSSGKFANRASRKKLSGAPVALSAATFYMYGCDSQTQLSDLLFYFDLVGAAEQREKSLLLYSFYPCRLQSFYRSRAKQISTQNTSADTSGTSLAFTHPLTLSPTFSNMPIKLRCIILTN